MIVKEKTNTATSSKTDSGMVQTIHISPWIGKLGIFVMAFLWLMIVAASWAESAEPSEDDEYNFKWLDPDKKIYVLQNRKYQKARKVLISGMVGTAWSNPYRSAVSLDPRIAFYFSEALGVEAFYTNLKNSENSTFKALGSTNTPVLPIVREIRGQYGLLLHYVPWYSKINVFNNILYFDWYFSAGYGALETALDTRAKITDAPIYETANISAFFVGTGHQYHLSQTFVIRLDFTGAFYNAPLAGNTGESSLFTNYIFGAGLGLRL